MKISILLHNSRIELPTSEPGSDRSRSGSYSSYSSYTGSGSGSYTSESGPEEYIRVVKK